MQGETDLAVLIGGMKPRLRDGVYVFATLPPGQPAPPMVEPVMVFQEAEGCTFILTEGDAAKLGLDVTFRCRMITLEIHSALEAVGFLAAITTRLAASGMGVNPVSAFYHDHLFVPADRAEEAVALLEEMAREA
ncbi:hypothetical protein MesoLjLc_13970 [Mesorhizobium sp. L-8-10]|uniref:ACT domain-containing protein n=1 Tax=Mesorhizobium sp. L-8-10 TaxID=2744523 RepID=UPI001925C82D|nr:ACT domain-containing protein [Mesorhizobium sp. L-8-10]BCH29467.1 hypothetical protein MesoLjLc_13970 [Mesorhizobium sp. L-8-10]